MDNSVRGPVVHKAADNRQRRRPGVLGTGAVGARGQRQRVVMMKPATMNANPMSRFQLCHAETGHCPADR